MLPPFLSLASRVIALVTRKHEMQFVLKRSMMTKSKALSSDAKPGVKPSCSAMAAAAGFNPCRRCHPHDKITEAYVFVFEKARQPYPDRPALGRFFGLPVAYLSGFRVFIAHLIALLLGP